MWKRGLRDTFHFFGWNKKNLLLPILWIAGAIVFYFWQGIEAVMGEVFVAIAFGLIPVGVFALLLLIWNLIRAPVYLKWEKEKEPILVVTGISLVNYGTSGIGYSWRLKINNMGIQDAENCRGQLVALADIMPQKYIAFEKWPINEYLE